MPSVEDLQALDGLSRDELIGRARSLGAKRPELMTRVELRDEIVRLTENDPIARRRSRGWLGVARDLVASVVDAGLNLPGAAAAIRGGARATAEWQGPAPVATLTLAEIYVAQGHPDRAQKVLDEVLRNEPDHAAALALKSRLSSDRGSRARPPEANVTLPFEDPDEGPPPESERVPVIPVAAPEPSDDGPPPPLCAVLVSTRSLTVRYELEGPVDGATLRVVSFVPRREGPERHATDVAVDAAEASGGVELPVPVPGAVVRAVLGTGSEGAFRPLTVAWVYAASASAVSLEFGPPGREPRALRANLEAALRVAASA